jgi:hypothetical protein
MLGVSPVSDRPVVLPPLNETVHQPARANVGQVPHR